MATNFPNSPSNGDTHTFGGATYTYNSTRGAWLGPSSGGSGGASVTVSETAPTSPSEGDLWFDPSVLKTFVYYNDGTTNQWVQNNPTGGGGSGGGGASVTVSETAPSSPSAGDLWWSSSEAVMYIYYTDADSSQWVQATTPGADGAAGADGSAAVYATIDLLPASANTGDQAFVTGSNRLYLWNGTGWYNIALINTNPSISGVSSSYTLAQDGTATTVTIVASDPEGLPITYSLASDTSGSTATVVQGTGASTNVFTITPSTSSVDAGTFTLTFRASDGVNIATAPAEFSLAFQVVNSSYTSALITSVGADNAVNNAFIDSSTHSHTITAFGDAHQTTFSPYRHGGYSLHFPGAVRMDLGFSTLNSGDWTFECWAKIEAGDMLLGKYNGGNQLEAFGVNSTTGYMYTHTGAGNETPTCNNDLRDGKWHYLVWERYNGTYYYWADGSLEASFANTETPAGGGNWSLGGWSAGQFTGNIKEARLSLTTAVYTGSAPTTPTEPQTTAKSTDAFFTGVGLEVKDYSSNNRTFTPPATLEVQPTAPYDYTQYSSAVNGGSMSFDGTGDYLNISNDASLSFGTGEFTFEFWMYRTATNATYQSIVSALDESGTGAQMGFFAHSSNNTIQFYSSNGNLYATSNTIKSNTWHHICATRNSSNVLKIYIDGIEGYSATITDNFNTGANGLNVGRDLSSSNGTFAGSVADVRLVKGTVVYTANFTPPTAPLTAITNTSLLLKGTNAGIIDKSQSVSTITLNGDVSSSTTHTKYLSSSMYFDGTGDYITLSDSDAREFGGEDFTIELWVKTTIATQYATLLSRTPTPFSSGMWSIMMNTTASGGQVAVYVGDYSTGASLITTSGASIRDDSWHHVAVVRNGSSFVCYIDGTSRGTGSWAGSIANIAGDIRIGADQNYGRNWQGYMSDIRLTKGLARYTSAFTPPTAALKG